MPRKFVDMTVYGARNMSNPGNIDFGYWFDKTSDEKVAAATRMIETAFQEPLFVQKRGDRNVFTSHKHSR
jgi:hypothetical protein